MYEKRKCGKVNFNNGTFYKRIFSQIGTVRADVGTESLYFIMKKMIKQARKD